MKSKLRVTGYRRVLLALAALLAFTAHAGDGPVPGELRMVIVLSRHGVRSPTADPAHLGVYARDAWPAWPVPPGYLTPHGRRLMTIMGRWYRAHYAQAGLLPVRGCLASALYVVADDEQRTLESARGLMDGFDPNCDVTIAAAPRTGPEVLFAHDFSGADAITRAQAQAAVLGRMGGDATRMAFAHAGLIGQMESVLMGCAPAECDPRKAPGKKWLMEQPAAITPGQGDELLGIKSPLHVASTLAEDIYLEYVEGMPMPDVAWGRVTPLQLGQLLALHADYTELSLRTPAVARAYAAHLARRILATLQQASGARPGAKALGPAGAKFVFLVGHDTNIETLAGLLGLDWLLPEQPVDPTSAGGALVFELRHHRDSGRDEVSVYYVSQSMQQMRDGTELDPAHPPLLAPIFIPDCSSAAPGYPCPLDRLAARLGPVLQEERATHR